MDLEKEWNDYVKHSCGVYSVCQTCGGSSSSFCQCAKDKWMADKKREIKLNPEEICCVCGKDIGYIYVNQGKFYCGDHYYQ